MVPESTRTLLPDLEAIERVMEEKQGANLKAKAKGKTAPAEAANLQAKIQAAGFLRVPPKSPFKKLLLGTGLWRYTCVK